MDDGTALGTHVGLIEKGVAADLKLPQRYRLFIPLANDSRSTTAVGILDRTLGRIGSDGSRRGLAVIRVDGPDRATPYYHLNQRPEVIPHRPISKATYVAAGYAGKSLKFVQKVALPVAVFADGVRIFDAFAEDEYSIGENTITRVSIIGGEWAGATAGAWGGAKTGAGIGFLIYGPPGAAIGGVIGGIAGGIGGSYSGGYLMDVAVTKTKTVSNNRNDRLK